MTGSIRAIILAAGEGRRLRDTVGTVKLYLKIAGLNLVCYPLLSAYSAGVPSIVLATRREHAGQLGTVVSQCCRACQASHAYSWRWWAGNAYTLLDALESLPPGRTLILVGDHIVHPEIVRRVIEGCDWPFCVGGDRDPTVKGRGEETRINAASDGRVTSIGKGLDTYTHVDVGVHLVDPTLYTGNCGRIPLTLNMLKQCAARRGLLKVVDVTGLPWLDVDTPGDLGPAERLASKLKTIFWQAGERGL
ncbi:MAG: NTP transferase domain-containing protein [Desulfurococcales archaeon]|nr:NTP transferase domain-containing protein [Desulfurococcales archaeon]